MTNTTTTRPPAERFAVSPFTFHDNKGLGVFIGKQLALFIPNLDSLERLLDDLEAHEHVLTTNTKAGNK